MHHVHNGLEEAALKSELDISNVKGNSVNNLPIDLISSGSFEIKDNWDVFQVQWGSWERNEPESIDSSINSSVDVETCNSKSGFVGAWDEPDLFLIKSDILNINAINFYGVCESLISETNVESLFLKDLLHSDREDQSEDIVQVLQVSADKERSWHGGLLCVACCDSKSEAN